MAEIRRSAILPYPASFMYALVNDVEAYPEFLPWCGGAKILARSADSMDASILIERAGVRQWFTTRNRLAVDESIEMELLDGPFERLHGRWRFESLAGDGCRIEFVLWFEMKRGLASAIIAPAFKKIANTLVDSFCDRAREQYAGQD